MDLERTPDRYSRPATLRDGTPMLIRAIRHDDRERIIAAFHKLEQETLYTRFFAVKKELTDADLGRIDASDFVHSVVLVATLGSGEGETIIGGASYNVLGADAALPTAEVAFTIEEDYQGQGLASRMFAALIEIARERGLGAFEAEVLAGNTGMLKVFRRSGLPMTSSRDDGVLHLRMDLRPA